MRAPAQLAKVQSLLPRKLNGIATATAIAWAVEVADAADADQDLEHSQIECQRSEADGEEAGRLEAGPVRRRGRRSSSGSRGSC